MNQTTPPSDGLSALCEHYPPGSRATDARDGFTAEVVAVGTSRGKLSVWLDGRPAVPAEHVRGAS